MERNAVWKKGVGLTDGLGRANLYLWWGMWIRQLADAFGIINTKKAPGSNHSAPSVSSLMLARTVINRSSLGLDVLVNNAGIMHTPKLEDLSAQDFEEAMRVNVLSAVTMIQAATKHLEVSPLKNVVNVSSIAGLRAYPGAIAYKMSKAAMDQLTRCSALELAPKGMGHNQPCFQNATLKVISN